MPRRRLVRDASAPRIWRSTPRISVRILDCHSRTMSFGSFFLNIAMKPMASLSHGSARAPRSGEPSAPQLASVTSAHEVFDMFDMFDMLVF